MNRIGGGLTAICQAGRRASALGMYAPIVPRPPTLKWPNRAKGAEQVTMLGVTLRMTITSDGFDGTNLDDMLMYREDKV